MTNEIKIQHFFCKFQKNFTHFREKIFCPPIGRKNVAFPRILRYTVTHRAAGASSFPTEAGMKKLIDRTLIVYLIVGILNFILCTGIMFVLFNLCGVSSHLAPLVNYGLGSTIWYLACKYIVFPGRRSTGQQLLRFVFWVLICYLISYYIIARPCAKLLLQSERFLQLFSFGGAVKTQGNCQMTLGAAAYAILNYFGQRFFVFNSRLDRPHHRNQE